MTYTWDYGINLDTDTPPAGIYRGGGSSGSSDEKNDFYLCAQPMNGLRDGLDISVTRFQFRLRNFANVDDQKVHFYDVSGNDWVSQANGQLSQDGWAESNTQTKAGDFSASPIAVSVGSGTWCGLVFTRGDETTLSNPGCIVTGQLTAYTAQTHSRGMIWHDADPESFTVGTDATLFTPGDRRAWMYDMRFTTEQNLVCDIPSPGANDAYLIPALVSGHGTYAIKIEDVVVAGGNSLTINLLDTTTGSNTPIASETAVVDMGATDQMTFDGANVTGITAGDTYDLIIQIRLSDGAIKFSWVNKTTGEGVLGADDHTTIDHKAASAGTRDTWATNSQGPPRMIEFAGTATIGRIQVAAFPIVACFDSQGLGSNPMTVISGRLIPALNTEWGTANKQMWWYNGGSGQRLKDDNGAKGGLLDHLDPAVLNIGTYDLREVRGRYAVNLCVNDFANSADSLLTTQQNIAGELNTLGAGYSVVFADGPPASSAAFTAAESQALKDYSDDVLSMLDYNDAVFGVEVSWSKFNGGQDGGGIYEPKNIDPATPTWFNSDELHYESAGAAIKATSFGAAILEGGLHRQTGGPIGSATSFGYRHKDFYDQPASTVAGVNAEDMGGVNAADLASPQAAVDPDA